MLSKEAVLKCARNSASIQVSSFKTMLFTLFQPILQNGVNAFMSSGYYNFRVKCISVKNDKNSAFLPSYRFRDKVKPNPERCHSAIKRLK